MAISKATYVYCLVKSDRKPSIAGAPRGVPGGGALRFVEGVAGTWIAACDVSLSAYGAGAINRRLKDMDWVSSRALAHEAVVEFCARARDVIPMKLFTIFRDDERARAQLGDARVLARVFQRIAGCAEWSVRVSCSPAAVLERADGPAPRSSARSRPIGESGASFLRRKKDARDQVRHAAAAARGVVEQVFERLDTLAKDSVRKRTDMPGSSLSLDAAFLVPRKKQQAFERAAERLALSTSRAGCDLVLSGPWPAYHFVGGD
jgi:gas vesicle protein GvpL/GvpF